jgi:hypothetical protein
MPTETTKIAADGADLAPDATDWVALRDDTTGLTWSRANIGDKRLKHKQAVKACTALDLAGATDWRLPTIRELQRVQGIAPGWPGWLADPDARGAGIDPSHRSR